MLRRSCVEPDDFSKLYNLRHVRVSWIATLAARLAPSVETPRIGLG